MRTLLVAIILFSFLIPVGVTAQSPLSEAEAALLDRALSALAAIQDYDSFTRADMIRETSATTISLDGTQDSTREDRVLQQELRFVGADVQGTYAGTFSSDRNGIALSATMQGEVRYVGDVLYLVGDYEKTAGIVPFLPEGWVLDQEALTAQPFISLLDIESLYEQFRGEGYSTFIDAADFVKLVVDQVSTTAITLPDGRAAEEITFRVPSSGLYTLASQNPDFDPLNPVLSIYQHTSPASEIIVTLTLDSDGTVIKTAYVYRLEMRDIDLYALDSASFPEGMTGTFLFNYSGTRYYSDVNQVLEPPVAPDGF